MPTKHLSKSSFMAGLVCPRRLWQNLWDRESAAPLDGMSELIMEMGSRFGVLAHQLYPGATLIDVDIKHIEQAILDTEAAIADGASVILEAGFQYQQFRVLSDVIERQPDGSWHLTEVKSSTRVKEEHYPDLAYQRWVMEKSGHRVSRCSVLHANNKGRWPDVASLFAVVDVTEHVAAWLPHIEPSLQGMVPLMQPGCPAPDARENFSKECHHCPYKKSVCWQGIDDLTIYDVVDARAIPALEAQDVFYVDDIPESQQLNAKDRRNVRLIKAKSIDVHEDIVEQQLTKLSYPIYFLDFESIATAVPLYDDIGPWQKLAFQYSLHIQQENGQLVHREYLHTENSNPSRAVAERLVEDIGPSGSIVVYFAGMEKGVINDLRHQFPEYADALLGMNRRMWDLHPIFLKHYRHWRFGSKSSIKVVLPTLVPELSYKDLEVQDGGAASMEWLRMIETSDALEANEIAENLKAYCRLDTLAMVELLNKLRADHFPD